MKKKDLSNHIKTVKVVSTAEIAASTGPQGQLLLSTITNSVCGSEHIAAGYLVMPPARVAKPHMHKDNELIIFFLEGFGVAFIGRDFKPYFVGPGDFLYVPEGIIHFGINLSEKDRHTGIEIRTDPHFNNDVVLIPEMEKEANKLAVKYRNKFTAGTLEVPASWKGRDIGPYRHQEVM